MSRGQLSLAGNGQPGPSDLLPLSRLPSDFSRPEWLRTWPPHPPQAGWPPTSSIPERARPLFPARVRTWQVWAAERTRERPIPASEAARGERWVAASHNRPQDTEGRLSGDSQPHVNLCSGFGKPPPFLHTLLGGSSSFCLAVRWERNAGQNPL